MSSFNDICLVLCGGLGRRLFKLYRGIESDLEAAHMKVHPESYLATIIFMVIVAAVASSALFLVTEFVFQVSELFQIAIVVAGPLLVLALGLSLPRLIASIKVSGLKVEIPYASAYLSVMASGGLPPYKSLLRLSKTNLVPKVQEEFYRVLALLHSKGLDPISAMEKGAKTVRLKAYRDLFLGYASTLRTGGDVLHYLYSQTENLFKSLAADIKSMGEAVALLMESYIIVTILGALGVYLMFIVSISMQNVIGVTLSPGSFFLFSFVLLPALSFAFICVSDAIQISYPQSSKDSYVVFGFSIAVAVLLVTVTTLPFLWPETRVFAPLLPLKDLVQAFTVQVGFPQGSEPAVGLALTLIACTVPAVVADLFVASEEVGVLHGITVFLRDLVETRKTGLSPERCILALSTKDYGRFSRHLRLIGQQLGWGLPLKKILTTFNAKVKSWLPRMNMFLLIDTIEVGGGKEQSLETLAGFAESMEIVEKERRSLLRPLIVVPYIGAGLLAATTVMFIRFLRNIETLGGFSVGYATLTGTLLTPLVLHSFMLGLVAGKMGSGRVASGFKHALILTCVTLVAIWFTPYMGNFGFTEVR